MYKQIWEPYSRLVLSEPVSLRRQIRRQTGFLYNPRGGETPLAVAAVGKVIRTTACQFCPAIRSTYVVCPTVLHSSGRPGPLLGLPVVATQMDSFVKATQPVLMVPKVYACVGSTKEGWVGQLYTSR